MSDGGGRPYRGGQAVLFALAVSVLGGLAVAVGLWLIEVVRNEWLHYGLHHMAAVRLETLSLAWVGRLLGLSLTLLAAYAMVAYVSESHDRADHIFCRVAAGAAGIVLVLYLGFQTNRYTFKDYWSLDDAVMVASLSLPRALVEPRVYGANATILAAGVALMLLAPGIGRRTLRWVRRPRAPWLLPAVNAVGVLLVGAVWASTVDGAGDQMRPNVLLISVDTLRADRLGVYGYDRATSPFIDEMARSGVVFERAMAVTNWTLPSHMSIMTGQLPAAHGVQRVRNRLSARKTTLAEVLRNAGYRTVAFTGGYNVDARFGFDQGFDAYHGDTLAKLSLEEKVRFGKGARLSYLLPQVVEWMEDHRARPFFMFLHFWDVHAPYMPHASYIDDLSPGYTGSIEVLTHELVNELNRDKHKATTADIARIRALYDNEIRYVDEYLGRLWEALKRLGMYDNTIVVLTSDHGDELMERFLGHGHALYDPEIHVPLIVRYPPRIPNGGRVGQVVSGVDILPTVLDLAGVSYSPAIAAEMQGRSLVGSWDQPLPEVAALSENAGRRLLALRSDHYKYVRQLSRDRSQVVAEELYDLRADPGESHNLIDTQSAIAARLAAELDQRLLAARNTRSGAQADQAHLSEGFNERLRALGYDP